MPEGDVLKRTATRLHQALAGRALTTSDLRWPSLATADLTGRVVLEVVARGKHILVRLDGEPPVTLHSHLRMDGSWHVHRTGEAWGSARSGIRAVLANPEWTAVGHLLGMLDLVPTTDENDLVGHLGPDLLGPDWDLQCALANLRQTPVRTIGEALLDQHVLAGIGTMFMAESLFVKGVNPWTPVGQVADLPALLTTVQRMLETNCARVVQSTTGDTRQGRTTWVHARVRQPCRRCGTSIAVDPIRVAPTDRVAFYCPRCQPKPP